MALATLSIDLTAKVAQFEQDLKKAAVASEKVSADMRAAFGTVGAALGGITGALSVGFVTQLVTASIDAVDALNDVKDATGASIENISALQDVAARTGTSFEVVESSLIKLNKVLNDATPGSQQEAILKRIGLSADELRKLDPAEAVLEVSKALSTYADDGDRARLVEELLGKSAKQLAPFLNDLAEQGKLVATVTKEQTAEAEKFNKALAVMKANAADVTRSISIDMITSLNDLAQAFKDGEAAGKGFFAVANNRYWENVSKVYGNAGDSADGYRKRLTEIDQQLSGGESRLLVRNALLREQAELQAKLAATPVTAATDQTGAEDARLGRYRPGVGPLPKAVIKQPRATSVTVDTSYQKLLEDIEKATIGASYYLETGKEISSAENFRLDLLKKINDEWTRGKLSLNEAVEAEGRMNDAYNLQLAVLGKIEDVRISEADAKRMAEYLKSLQDQNAAIADSNATLALQVQEIGLTTDQLSALKLARMDEAIAQREATLATAAANGMSYEEISALEQKIELLKKQRELTAQSQVAQATADSKADAEAASKDFADTMRNDLKGAFSAAFRDSSGDPLKAFGDALENMMFTRAATALSEAAMEGLGSIIGSLGGSSGAGIGDLIGSLFSFDGGGYTGSGARSGGVDGKGGFLSILHPNETVLDHTKGQTGTGGGISIVQNINVDSRSDAASIRAAMQQAKAETLAAIQQSRRSGGAYA